MKLGKCKQALADLINANGGWVDGEAIFAAMDGNGDLFGYSGRPQWTVSHGHWYGHTLTCWFFSPIVINNHHQTILSREEYYQAYPKADADGWIVWKGGECPVDGGDQVDYKLLSGNVVTIGEIAGDLKWSHEFSTANIIAYRLHKPDVKPEFCESVTRSIAEPESKQTIEQLALDYRNKLDFANSKQKEADEAKAAADAALGELKRAGEVLGLVIDIANPCPELVITDWRDLRVGDEIECVGYGHPHAIGVVEMFDEISVDQNISVRHQNGDASWPRLWKFIRRP